MQPLLPGERATVAIESIDAPEGAAPRWRFRVLRGDALLASGEVVAAAAEPRRERELEAAPRRRRPFRDLADPQHRAATAAAASRAPACIRSRCTSCCVRGPERRASRAYLTRVLGRRRRCATSPATSTPSPRPSSTACSCSAAQLSAFRRPRRAASTALHAQLDRGHGVLLFGSHLGSFEVLRVLARQRPRLRDARGARQGAQPGDDAVARCAQSARSPRDVIDAGQDGPSIVLAIKQATDEGALVALLVDRAQPGRARGCRRRSSARRRAVPDRAVADRRGPEGAGGAGVRPVPRRQPLRPGVRGVQRRLRDRRASERARGGAPRSSSVMPRGCEHHARSAPYNWFNFYDFWQSDDEGSPTTTTATTPRTGAWLALR